MVMTAINIADAQKNLKSLTDDVVDYNEYIIITKPQNRNVVLMPESEFQSWQETLYILDSDENRKALDKSIDQMNGSHVKTLSFEDWQPAIKED